MNITKTHPPRYWTNLMLERAKEGVYGWEALVRSFARFCSEADVEEMLRCEEYLMEEDLIEEDEED